MSGALAKVPAATTNRLIGLRQAAEYIGLSRTKLYRKVKANEIAHVRDGHLIYFRACDLDAWVEARVRGGQEAKALAQLRALPMPRRREFS